MSKGKQQSSLQQTQEQQSTSTQNDEENICALTCNRNIKYPKLNVFNFETWLINMELAFKRYKINSEIGKFYEAWDALEEYHNDLIDIARGVFNKSIVQAWTELHSAVKTRLCDKDDDKLEKIFYTTQLGTRKTSSLLREMIDICRANGINPDHPTLRIVFKNKLPRELSNKLVEYEMLKPDADLTTLAEMLDRVLPAREPAGIYAIGRHPEFQEILNKLNKMQLEIDEMNERTKQHRQIIQDHRPRQQERRSNNKQSRNTNRSKSVKRNDQPFQHANDEWCYTHQRYAYQAHRCTWKDCKFPRLADGSNYQPPSNLN